MYKPLCRYSGLFVFVADKLMIVMFGVAFCGYDSRLPIVLFVG